MSHQSDREGWRERLSERLWTEALPIVQAMLRDSRMEQLYIQRSGGCPLGLHPYAAQALHTSKEVRETWAVEIVMASVDHFIDKVLAEERWRSGPGKAGLTTFFIGNCALTFKNVLRKLQPELLERQQVSFSVEELLQTADLQAGPEALAVLRDTLRLILADAPDDVRLICHMLMNGMTHAEIGAEMRISPVTVEGRMYRFRQKVRRKVRRGQIESPYRTSTWAGAAK